MNSLTIAAATAYAKDLEDGNEEGITASATLLIEALEMDDTGDDFARTILETCATQEAPDYLAVARVIRAVFP